MNLTSKSYSLANGTNPNGTTPAHVATVVLLVVLLVTFSVMTLIRPAAAAKATIYVSTSGSNTTGTGSLATPYATITKAVSVASHGDLILVEPGTYHEMVNITATVTLASMSGDPTNTVIDASGLSMGVFVLGANAAGTVVQGFTVKNANNHGIYAQDTSNVVIEHNIVANNGLNPNPAFSGEDKALELVGTSYSVLAGNQVVGNLFGGIAINDNGPINPGFYSPGILSAAVGNVVSGNTVVGNRPHHCSIVVSAYDAGAGVVNNVVSNNLVVDNSAGVVVAANTPNSQAINNSVIFNTILNNGEAGVILHANSPGALNAGTLVMGNTISGNGLPIDIKEGSNVVIAKYTGVLIGGESTKVSPHGATVIENVFHNQYNGVFVVNGTGTLAYSNVFDGTVSHWVNGTAVTVNPLDSQLNGLSGAVSTMQGALSTLQQSAAKASDVSTLSNSVSSLQASVVTQGSISTISYVAFAAFALAIVLLGLDVILFRRRPAAP